MEAARDDYYYSPISSLPSELLLIILENLWDRDNRNLRGCSLVCSNWRPIVQTMLFTEAILTLEEDASSFLRAMQSNPLLGQATKILDFRRLPSATYQAYGKLKTQPNQIKDIVPFCPKLYQLVLCVPPELDGQRLKSLLPPHTFATLRALHFSISRDRSIMGGLGLHDILHFLHQFSSLSHLRIEDTFNIKPPDLSLPSPSLPSFQLYEFSWLNFVYEASEIAFLKFVYVTDWLFVGSPRWPRVYVFDEWDYRGVSESLQYFLKKYARDLVSLSTPVGAASVGIQLSESCPNLRELILHDDDLISPKFRSTIPTAHLEHLGCGLSGAYYSEEELVLEIIDWAANIPSLRCITLYTHGSSEDDDHLQEWEKRCGKKTEIRVVSMGEDHYLKRRDFVVADRFPREDGTMSNLRHMLVPPSLPQ